MGMIDTMVLSSAVWNGVIPGPALLLWGLTVVALAASSCGIWLARARETGSSLPRLRVLRTAAAH